MAIVSDLERKTYFQEFVKGALKRYARRVWAQKGQHFSNDHPYMEETPYDDGKYLVMIWLEGKTLKYEVKKIKSKGAIITN